MNFSTDGRSARGALIRKQALPARVSDELDEQQEKATYGWWRTLWNKVRGYTAGDARRLKNAAVQGVEGESAKRVSEARKLDAEAQLLYAEAEVKRREAALKDLEYERQCRELQSSQLEEDTDRLERIAEATERLSNAISKIRQMGGDVAFDQEQLEKLLRDNSRERVKALRASEEAADDPRQP